MAQSLPSFVVPTDWTDLAAQAGYTSLSGATAVVQNIATTVVHVFFGSSGSPPAHLNDGFVLLPTQSVSGTASHIWVRGDAVGVISAGLTD
jgi:hypothetical protein